VETPIGQVEFHIMPAKTLFLLSLADMDKLGVYFNNLTNCLVISTRKHVPVVRRFGHSFLLWNTSLQSFISESFNCNPCFLAKERERLTSTHDLKFNGGIIHLEDDESITLTQERQYKNLKLVRSEDTSMTSSRGAIRQNLNTKEQYIAQRARGAYVASVCQPEAAYDLSIAAQAIKLTEKDVKTLNKRI
jgi:hypothetical protein